MGLAEAERRAKGLSADEAAELWQSVFLTVEEVGELLEHVEACAAHPWIHPLVATAAYTGARKSELLRIRGGDVDFEAGVVAIRERKRSHARRTARRVPMSSHLAAILKAWLAVHPGGPQLFAHAEVVARSRKRRPTTARDGEGSDGKVASPVPTGPPPLTVDECHWHFKRTLEGSRWAAVRGLHTLRHSFVSALASKGVDQRLIDEFAGHSTEEQRRRYRHLHAGVQSDAILGVFG
ncbi:tyrosine-type recombinase/integrase [Paludisphaera soli]|uniref:tyrosine-type recombinase/integrase n=1 Tax=Paludisphaera soli TaxID=2712865 RepID=UPI0013EDB6BD|nr:tyrosine-type recombinase/integrase [Paludisphaera soli]